MATVAVMAGSANPAFEALKAGLDVRAAGRIVAADAGACPTGLAELDLILGGGFPRGTIGTLEGAPSSGRTAILAGMLAESTRRGMAALADDGWFYPPDFERAGVALDRLLIVSAVTPLASARAADILLRSRAFGLVVLPAVSLRAAIWSRLGALAHKAGAVLLAIGTQASTELAYFASTRVRCAIERVLWSGDRGIFYELAGYELGAQVIKHRRIAPGASARVRIPGDGS